MSINEDLFKELSKYEIKNTDIWLFSALSSNGMQIGSGYFEGYKEFCELSDYYEETTVLTSQNSGIKGVCSTNAFFALPKSNTSLNLYKEFIENHILKNMIIVKVLKIKKILQVEQQIKFFNCRIERFKIFLNNVNFHVRYSGRQETFTPFNNGTKEGHISVSQGICK